jgi:hypothetical protein
MSHYSKPVRDAFLAALESYANWNEGPEPTVKFRRQQMPISAVCGLVWNCTDTLPDAAWDTIRIVNLTGDMKLNTYAAAARALRPHILAETE